VVLHRADIIDQLQRRIPRTPPPKDPDARLAFILEHARGFPPLVFQSTIYFFFGAVIGVAHTDSLSNQTFYSAPGSTTIIPSKK
jgi:hypothetical protein